MTVVTSVDLVLGTLIGALFILAFRLQRIAWPGYYFAFGELIYGLRATITPMAVLMRTGIVFMFALLSFALLRRSFPVYFGIALGSFLIVWPAIVLPLQVEPVLYHRRKWLLLAYGLFVAYSVLTARVAELTYSALRPIVPMYIATWKDPARVLTFLGDSVLVLVLTPIIGVAFWRLLAWLNKEFALRGAEMEDEMEEYLYGAEPREEA